MISDDESLPQLPPVPGAKPHLLLVRAPYYRDIIEGMTEGAIGALAKAGATHGILDVAGAFELPQAIRIALRGRRHFDAYVALGCVIKGETDHYDFICAATMQGLMDVGLRYGIALGCGLLTVDSLAQAQARSGKDRHNKGAEATVAALGQLSAARRMGSW